MLNRTRLLRKARADVSRVKQYAEIVLNINDRGEPIQIKWNDQFHLKQLVVVGPGWVAGEQLDEVVLYEVGRGKARPYKRAEKKKVPSIPRKVVVARIPQAPVSRDQINNSLSVVWKILIHDMLMVRSRWKGPDRPTYMYVGPRHKRKRIERESGVRYSVALADTLLLRSVLKSEFNKREIDLEKHLHLFVQNMILKNLSDHSPFMSDKKFWKSLGNPDHPVSWIWEWLERNLPLPHHIGVIREAIDDICENEYGYMFERILGHHEYLFGEQQISEWTGYLQPCDIPIAPEGVFVRCLSFPYRNARGIRRNGQSYQRLPESLTFEIAPIPGGIVDPIDQFGLGTSTITYATDEVPF